MCWSHTRSARSLGGASERGGRVAYCNGQQRYSIRSSRALLQPLQWFELSCSLHSTLGAWVAATSGIHTGEFQPFHSLWSAVLHTKNALHEKCFSLPPNFLHTKKYAYKKMICIFLYLSKPAYQTVFSKLHTKGCICNFAYKKIAHSKFIDIDKIRCWIAQTVTPSSIETCNIVRRFNYPLGCSVDVEATRRRCSSQGPH